MALGFKPSGQYYGEDSTIKTYAQGGYVGQGDLNMGVEAAGIAIAAAAIALDLNEEQAREFMEKAYGLCRGQTVPGKYATLIELAYRIKNK